MSACYTTCSLNWILTLLSQPDIRTWIVSCLGMCVHLTVGGSKMSYFFRRLCPCITLVVLVFSAEFWLVPLTPAHGESYEMVGWVEKVCILPGNLMLRAKVDSGAVSCCLHAPDVVQFDRNGEKWVRFHILDIKGNKTSVEGKVVGVRRIKRHFGAFQDRLVIRLGVCLGNVYKKVDVNLVDRSGFDYPMLIGRNFMQGKLVINPSTMYTVEPNCGAIKQAKSKVPSPHEASQ